MHHRNARRALIAAPALVLAAIGPTLVTATAHADGAGVVRTLSRATTTTFQATPTGSAAPTDHQLAPDLEGLAATGTTQGAKAVANRSQASQARALRTLPLPGAVATALVAGSTTASVGTTINGLNGLDQRTANHGNQFYLEPPDQALCVGNGHVVEAVNDVLRVYSPTGGNQTGVEDLNTFLGYPAMYDRATGLEGPFVTDPVCLFDKQTGAFFLTTLTLEVNPVTGAFTGKNTLDVATATDPTRAWTIYHLAVQDDGTDGTPNHGALCPCIGDYPHIGADANGFYITTNEYPFFANGFVAAQLYAFPKAQLAAGLGSLTGVQIDTSGLDAGKPGFTVWPAMSPSEADFDAGSGGTEWFLSSNAAEEAGGNYHGTQVVAWALTGTSSLRSKTPHVTLSNNAQGVADYYLPPLADQKVGPTPLADCLSTTSCEKALLGKPSKYKEFEGSLDAGDTRMQQTYWTGGKLYGALDTAVSLPSGVKAGIAYYVLAPTVSNHAVSTSLTASGTFGVDANNVTYPTMGVTAAGKAIMSFTLVGRDYFPSQAFTTLTAALAPTKVQVTAAGLGPQDGFSEYRAFGDPPRPRWGDYGASSVVDGTIWTANEWIAQSCTYEQYIAAPFGRCGNMRGALVNWGTAISSITP